MRLPVFPLLLGCVLFACMNPSVLSCPQFVDTCAVLHELFICVVWGLFSWFQQYGTPEDDTSSSSSPSDPDVDPTELHEPRHRRKQRRPRRPFVKPSVEDRAVMETFVLSSDEEDTFDLNEYEGVVRAFEEAEEHRRTQENRDTQRQEEEVTDQDDDDGEEEEEEEEVEEEEEEEEEYENSGGVNYENVVIPPLPLRERPRVPGSAVGQVMSPQPRMVDSFQDLTSQQESLLQFYRSLNTELYLHQREQESRPSRLVPHIFALSLLHCAPFFWCSGELCICIVPHMYIQVCWQTFSCDYLWNLVCILILCVSNVS